MVMHRRVLGLCVWAILCAASPPMARAGFTQIQTAVIPTTTTDWAQSATFHQVTVAPGDSLKQVVITLSYNFLSTYAINFVAPTPTTITAVTYDADMTLHAGSATKSINITMPSGGGFQSFIGELVKTGTPSDGTQSTSKAISGTVSIILTPSDFPNPGDFAKFFIGTGTFTLPITAHAASFVSVVPGNGNAAVRTMAGASLQLQFVFVPEPRGAALLASGIGLIVAAGVSRRRGLLPAGRAASRV